MAKPNNLNRAIATLSERLSGTGVSTRLVFTYLALRGLSDCRTTVTSKRIMADTGLSRAVVFRSLAALKEAGVITRSGVLTRLHLDPPGVSAQILKGLPSETHNQPEPTIDSDLSLPAEESSSPSAGASGVQPVADVESAMPYPKSGPAMSPEEIVAKQLGESEERTLDSTLSKYENAPPTQKTCCDAWRDAHLVFDPETPFAGLPAGEQKFISAMRKQHGAETLPRIIRTVANWTWFASNAADWSGKKVPVRPSVSYLAAHANYVTKFCAGEEKPALADGDALW